MPPVNYDIVFDADISELQKECLEHQIKDLQNTVITLEQDNDELLINLKAMRVKNNEQAKLIMQLQYDLEKYTNIFGSPFVTSTSSNTVPITNSNGNILGHKVIAANNTGTVASFSRPVYDPFTKDIESHESLH